MYKYNMRLPWKPCLWYMYTCRKSCIAEFMILQGSARPEVRSELYEERKARI